MRVGVGLPITAADVVLEWARRADAGPFDTVTVADRVVGDNVEPIAMLAAVAGATARVHMRTQLLLATLRQPALLAKQAATIDRISGGRLAMGIGVGEREDDFVACGVSKKDRAKRLDSLLVALRGAWDGKPFADEIGAIGPRPCDAGPPLLFGGFSEAAVQRVVRWGTGYISPGRAEHSGLMFARVNQAWREAGRAGRPELVAQANVALGSAEIIAEAQALIRSYYSFLDVPGAGSTFTTTDVVDLMLTTGEQIRNALIACEQAGVREMGFVFWAPAIEQLTHLADALD